jgi:poly(3-hydroxyoctanoate) depolymerase
MLAGEEHPIVPLVDARLLSRCIADARLHLIRGGGHLFPLGQPDQTLAVLEEFPGSDVG